MTVGLCTDSNAQLPAALAERYGVTVVPMTVTVDGHDHLEGVDLDTDEFYARFDGGRHPVVATSPPSSGQFALAYDDMVAGGCDQILSIHIGAVLSTTLNAARVGARSVPVPIRLVDSTTAGFGTACCVWAAAEALAAGASLDEAAAVAERIASRLVNRFVVGDPARVRASERVDVSALAPPLDGADGVEGWPILSLAGDAVHVVGHASDFADAVGRIAAEVIAEGRRVRVGVGHADPRLAPVADALAHALGESAAVLEVVRYRIGASIAAHTGAGMIGCFVLPVDA